MYFQDKIIPASGVLPLHLRSIGAGCQLHVQRRAQRPARVVLQEISYGIRAHVCQTAAAAGRQQCRVAQQVPPLHFLDALRWRKQRVLCAHYRTCNMFSEGQRSVNEHRFFRRSALLFLFSRMITPR